MNKPLRVLQVEDSESDASLIVRLLEKAGYDVFGCRVETAGEFRAALADKPWDVIVADYRLPQFDAPGALDELHSTGLDTPLIVVSGTVGEDVAVEMMKFGAQDYLMKDNLARLAPAVEREIREAQTRRRRRQAEEAVRRSEERYRMVLETSIDGFWVADSEGRILDVNRAYCRLTGYSREELLQMRVQDLDVYLGPAGVELKIQEVTETGSAHFETKHCTRDGRIVDIEVSSTYVPRDDTRCSFLRDISARKQAEKALRESEERYRRVVEGAPEGIFVQTGYRFRYLNPAAIAMFHAESQAQLLGEPVWERIHPDFHFLVAERLRRVQELGLSAPQVEEQFVRLDGTSFDVEAMSEAFTFEGREGAIIFFREITERKKTERERETLENQLQQARKLESLGRLAGGIAHDFNNILTVINGYADLMLGQLAQDNPLRHLSTEMRKAGERGSDLTRQLLAFSRKQLAEPKPVDLNGLISESENLLRRLLGEDVELETKLAPELGWIMADPGQIHQILLNLAVNARDAMPNGGKLIIETDNVELDANQTAGNPDMAPGPFVKLSVTDTGTGIRDEDQQHIFDPFFTTKADGQGTGLGLSTVYGIVRQNGGTISVNGVPGRGSEFAVYLPRHEWPAEPHAESAVTAAVPRSAETILVAEGLEDVRRLIAVILTNVGCRVLEAATGPDALELAERHAGPIHLMLTDLAMPDMPGNKLAERLKALRPETKVIFLSAHPVDSLTSQGTPEAGTAYLAKPFAPETLIAKVREVLGPPPFESEHR